ncbi:MAG: amidohydrolase [Bacteroidota bacterium]|nr:amidohydrolase [Bacteroidota bacterium]MDP4205503.1 amidohydrolase [Bacteroidota bacterium]
MNEITDLRVTVVQADLKWEDKKANLDHLKDLLKEITPGQTDLIAFPEFFTTGFSMDSRTTAETMEGQSIVWMADMAVKTGAVVCGSLPIIDQTKYFNRFIWITPDGRIGHYDKRHLYRVGNETAHFSQGGKRVVFQVKDWRICPQVCYDLRYPVWNRSRNDYDILLNVANWPVDRIDIWKTLLKARAIENQAYVMGVNRVGTDACQVNYGGSSLVANLNGDLLLEATADTEAVQTVVLSMKDLEKQRNALPVFREADDFEIKEFGRLSFIRR